MLEERRWRIVRRSDTKNLSIAEIKVSERSLADAHRVCEYGLEDRLQLPGRRRDDLQHLGGRCLLLQRLGELTRAPLFGIEQAYVLNRDRRLVGELLQQFFLRLRDGSGLRPTDNNGAKRIAPAQHRHSQHSPPAHGLRKSLIVVRIGEHVLQANQ
jgi:hypothetical protein